MQRFQTRCRDWSRSGSSPSIPATPRSTVYKWSSGERPSPYPEPVRKNGRVIGWRREDVEAADKANKYSRADWLYGRKAA